MSATAEKKEAMTRPMMEVTEEGADRKSTAMAEMTTSRRRRRRLAAEPAAPRRPDRRWNKAEPLESDSDSLDFELDSKLLEYSRAGRSSFGAWVYACMLV